MADHPDGRALVKAALAALRDDVLPGLEGRRRDTCALVIAALASALREFNASDARSGPREVLRERLAALYGADAAGRTDLECCLARDIRAGRFDDDEAIRSLLLDQLHERLAVTNPDFVETGVFSRPGSGLTDP